MLQGSLRRPIVIVTLAAALLRLTAAVVWANVDPQTAQVWEYGQQAICALHHGYDLCLNYPAQAGVYPSALMPPLASYLWLGLFVFFGDTQSAHVAWLGLSGLAAVASVPLLFLVAQRLGLDRSAALCSAAIMAVYPTFVFICATYHTTNFTTFLMLLTILLCDNVAAAEKASRLSWTALGCICALLCLTRSEMLAICPVLLGLTAAQTRAFGRVAAALLAFALVLSPWTARNYLEFHRFVPSAQSDGYNLWKGFNPYAIGSGNLLETPQTPGNAERLAIRQSVAPGDEYEVRLQSAYRSRAVTFIREADAADLARLMLTKLAMLLLFDWTDTLTHNPAYWAPWLVANLLAAAGGVIAWTKRGASRFVSTLCFTMVGLEICALLATGIHTRYRMHLEPFEFILAGIGAGAIIGRMRRSIEGALPSLTSKP